jgi:hypothetical protein
MNSQAKMYNINRGAAHRKPAPIYLQKKSTHLGVLLASLFFSLKHKFVKLHLFGLQTWSEVVKHALGARTFLFVGV